MPDRSITAESAPLEHGSEAIPALQFIPEEGESSVEDGPGAISGLGFGVRAHALHGPQQYGTNWPFRLISLIYKVQKREATIFRP